MVYGVSPTYQRIAGLRARVAADSSTRRETARRAPVAVLGEAAAATLFGADDPVGQLREGQRAVVPGDRRRRPAAHGRRPTSPACRRRIATT